LDIGAGSVDAEAIRYRSILPRLDGNLRLLLNAGTRFAPCETMQPDGAELP
jgi:hypothetical protein